MSTWRLARNSLAGVSPSPQVLIVGAGPSGLAAALFLSRRGVSVRIVDAAARATTTSKALAVNPRTLELLEQTGVSDCIRAEGLRVDAIQYARDGRLAATLRPRWDRIAPGRPMTALPQARTEALLAEALVERGIAVERLVALTGLTQDADAVRATLSTGETVTTALLLGADGAHSAVRHALDLPFDGDASPEPWDLMDVELPDADPHTGRIDLQPAGPVVVLPLAPGVFRLIGFGGDLLNRLPAGWRPGRVIWESTFKVSHRIVPTMAVGRVALAGDAAHIHSPVGGRGMNLGIEDAFVFAACAADALAGQPSRLDDYSRLRLPVDGAWVKTSRAMTQALANPAPMSRLLFRFAPPLLARAPFLIDAAIARAMGLDHPVRVR